MAQTKEERRESNRAASLRWVKAHPERKREINRAYEKRYYAANRKLVREQGRERSRIIKAKAVEYLGGQCVDCGLRTCNLAVYDFDHKDPTEKELKGGSAIGTRWGWERTKAELDKCVLRCANCHRIRHHGHCAEEVA